MLQEEKFIEESEIREQALDQMDLNYFVGFANPMEHTCYVTRDKVYFVPKMKISAFPIRSIELADIDGYKKGFGLRFTIKLKDGEKVLLSLWKKSKLIAMLDAHRNAGL